MPLTDADIAKFDASRPLTDADIAAHDQAQTPDPGFLGTLFSDAKSIPAGVAALVRHPIDTAKAAIGQTSFDVPSVGEFIRHPIDSTKAALTNPDVRPGTGLLGAVDVLSNEWQQGHHGEALAHLTELGLPIIFKGAGALAPKIGDAASAVGAAAGKVADVATSPAARDVAGIVSPRLAHTLSLADRLRRGFQAFSEGEKATSAAAPAEDTQLLDAIASSQTGKRFQKLGASDQAAIRDLAQRMNTGSVPQGAAPAPATPRPMAASTPAEPSETIFDIARREIQPTAPATPPATAKPAMSMKQAEAAMARKTPAPLEAPQSQYTASGDIKSPQLRAAEIVNANRDAKAARFAQALHAQGIEPADIGNIPMHYATPAQMAQGASPGWANIAELLGEKEPSGETVGRIYDQMVKLKQAESAVSKKPAALEIARRLRDELGGK